MKDKIITFTALAAVLAIGFIGLNNVDSHTGAAMLESRYCKCTYLPLGDVNNAPSSYDASQIAGMNQKITSLIRVRDAAQQANCKQYCASYAHRGMQLLSAEPAGMGGAPVDIEGYHGPEY